MENGYYSFMYLKLGFYDSEVIYVVHTYIYACNQLNYTDNQIEPSLKLKQKDNQIS